MIWKVLPNNIYYSILIKCDELFKHKIYYDVRIAGDVNAFVCV